MPGRPGSYVVRDAGDGGNADEVYPRTLAGLLEAMERAAFRSFGHTPQEVAIAEPGKPRRIIRRFENGREVPGIT
jgi:hypothetical protein